MNTVTTVMTACLKVFCFGFCAGLTVFSCADKPSGASDASGGGSSTSFEGTWVSTKTEKYLNDALVAAIAESSYFMVVLGNDVATVDYSRYPYSLEAAVGAGRILGGLAVLNGDTVSVTRQDPLVVIKTVGPTADTARVRYFQPYGGRIPPSRYSFVHYMPDVDDAYEPDNDITLANVLSSGVPQLHTQTVDDDDWFRIDLAADQLYEITVNGEYIGYADYEFYAADGSVIDSNDNLFTGYEPAGRDVITVRSMVSRSVYLTVTNNPVYRIEVTPHAVLPSPYSGYYYQSYWSQKIEYAADDSVALYELNYTENDFRVLYTFTDSALVMWRQAGNGISQTANMLAYLGNSEFRIDCDSVKITENGGELSYDVTRVDGKYTWTYRMKPYTGEVPPARWLTQQF